MVCGCRCCRLQTKPLQEPLQKPLQEPLRGMSPQGFDVNPVYAPVFWAHYVEFLNDQLEMEVTTELEESEIPREGILVEDEEDLIFPIDDVGIPVAIPILGMREEEDDGFECDTIPPSPIRREETVPEWRPSIDNILLCADVVALMNGDPTPGSRDNPIDISML